MSIFQDIRTAFSRRDNALNQLLLINVLVFVAFLLFRTIIFLATQNRQGHMPVLEWLALPSVPGTLLTRPWTLLTYSFIHFDFFHILFNLLNLYWFGALVREYLGDRRLVSLYVLGALAGAALYLLAFNLLPVFRGTPAILYGASASVTAVILAAATLLPDFTFSIILLGPVRIKYIAAVLVIVSIAGVNGGNPGGEIAHIGGAILGYFFIKQLQRGRDLGRPVQAVGDWVGRLVTGRPNLRVTHRSRPVESTTKATGPRKPGQEEIDLILDKISRSGYESLSKEEKQKLFKASQQ
ncbi:rhomboid family intramembrane serine protease [Hymenobacter lutimineralis]|uniref:Rhomboid family intramembrane serine protease n=1 Tax=Hymenobacter lutimineralis TaxID=2606448 RepID=A0A5D6V7N8_9BACT|nr:MULTISPECIES: rhomboid family intramembrane serine protease [Hymenobacter]QIX62545.1 rhomboid family intramembrane serine protease [Hymenobacter sp. BT18]TYZ11893.1 rhomboid family intramembrane serine protease [Hymenobacter lutimineralis]